MRHSNIEQVGDSASLYETPATDFVADFIGETNFVKFAADRIESGKAAVTFPGLKQARPVIVARSTASAPMGDLASGQSTSGFRKMGMRD